MNIIIAADHGGFEMKQNIVKYLTERGHSVADLGCDNADSVDYPIFARKVTDAILADSSALGILVCGTGIGMSIAANKVAGIRAAVCGDVYSAEMTRAHNNANILCLGARVIGGATAEAIVDKFVGTSFEGGRHEIRVGMYE